MKKTVIIFIAIILTAVVITVILLSSGRYRNDYYLRVDDQKYALCQSMLNQDIEPLADYKTVEDRDYIDVTTTPRFDWDETRIPAEVLDWEAQGYSCYPTIGEFDEDFTVTSVLWECEISFTHFSYLDPSQTDIQKTFESARYTCGLVPCTQGDGSGGKLILCTLK